MMRKLICSLAVSFLLAGCSSTKISTDATAFSTEPISDSAFLAVFSTDDAMSEQDVKRNLMFHSARAVIDRGFIHMRVENLRFTRKNTVTKARSMTDPLAPLPDPTSKAPAGGSITTPKEPTYDASLALTRKKNATAVIRFYRLPAGDTMAATEVMEKAQAGEVPQFP